TLAMTTAFRVDNGVPYPHHSTVGVLVVQDAPRPGSDPSKPVRASAFAGWALLTNPSRDEFLQRVKAASEWLQGSASARSWVTGHSATGHCCGESAFAR